VTIADYVYSFSDAMTVIAFLRTFGLEEHFKVGTQRRY